MQMMKQLFPKRTLIAQRFLTVQSVQSKLVLVQHRSIISSFFVSPMLQEREEKRITNIDTKEVFKRIGGEVETMSYRDAVAYLSDLAYVVIPFDKTQKEFQMLLSRCKLLLSQ